MTTSGSSPTPARGWHSVLPWLRLMRLPTVFTAMADILCGFLLTHQVTASDLPATPGLWLLLLASAGLYLSGMVLNDVFDAGLDAVERPERPIPSGRIRLSSAAFLGVALMTGGIVAAALVQTTTLWVAITIAICVLLYDGYAKATWLGPFVMGSCRGLNILLGASATAGPFLSADTAHVPAALGLTVYIIGVTIFARNEAGQASRRLMNTGIAVALCGLAIDAWMFHERGFAAAPSAWTMLALLTANIIFRARRAMQSGHPGLIQKTVGFMLLCIIFIDAAVVFAATGSPQLAAVVVVLTIPAMLLKRVVPLS
jgi:hypothetical protein